MDTAAAYPSTYLLLQLAPLTSRIKEGTRNIFEGNHFFHQIVVIESEHFFTQTNIFEGKHLFGQRNILEGRHFFSQTNIIDNLFGWLPCAASSP
ncbi:hypothetical protein KCV07_g9200, partial [Aureobasidium melanogenum]